jgi:predicted P-loop ATPase/GTPase
MIKLLKLITGEEIIADVTETQDALELKTPVRVVFTQEGVGMVPYTLLAKSDIISIKNQHVIYVAEPDIEALNAYNSQFGSGLVLPGNSGPNLKIIT